MKYELRENQGIPAPLLALMAVATGLSVANCYYNQPLLGSMAKDFAVNDFSASMVATLTQIGYVTGLVFVIPLGDLVSRKKLILTNYIVSACALLAISLAPNIYWVWGASLLAGASSVMAFRLFRGLRVYARMFSDDSQDAARAVCPFSRKLCRADEIFVAPALPIPVLAYRVAEGGIGLWLVLRPVELPCFPDETGTFLCK